jgi:cellulose synthase (UDP-forming)
MSGTIEPSVSSVVRAHAVSPARAVPGRDAPIGVGGTPQTAFGIWWEARPRLVRCLVAVALIWGGVWLTYRLAFSWRGANPVAFAVLGFVEVFNWLSLLLLAHTGWRWGPSVAPPPTPGVSIDVLVCTYDEPEEVVEATLAGCAALRYPHQTYLLDDGRRDSMQQLAQRWGAVWVTRLDNAHAKAGNINHALGVTDGELIFFLDADHVPLPDALDLTVGYFDDHTVALVQSPHDFYNQDSVQHYAPGRHEQSLFFEVICPGKDRHNAAFWCGSATIVRRSALVGIGGVATDTIAEDFHTTIKLHREGWRTRYHDQVLVQGLAPVDLDGYLLQRDRWARGNLAVFRLPESPLRWRNGLALPQRIDYFASLFAYASGLARLSLLGLLAVTLTTGALPARVGALPLLVLWVPSTILAMTSTTALCRGHMRLGESSHYTLLTAAVFTRALRCAFSPSRTKFKVTPKIGVDTGGWQSVRRLRIVLLLAIILVASLIWRGLALADVVHGRPLPGLALPLAVGLSAWELLRIAKTVRLTARRRQRRARYRFPCELPAVAKTPGWVSTATITDISLTGIRLVSDVPTEPGTAIEIATAVPAVDGDFQPIVMNALTRSCRPDKTGGWDLGIEVQQMNDESRRRLVTFCHVVHPVRQLRPRHTGPEDAPDGAKHDEPVTPTSRAAASSLAER